MTTARAKDFVIYVAMGLLVSLIIYVPVYLGTDIAKVLPRLKVIGSALIVMTCTAVESKRWISKPTLWIYLAVLCVLHIACANWIYDRGISVSVIGWVLIGSIEIYVFSQFFRRLAYEQNNAAD